MSTPFVDVYNRFLGKITDDMYVELTPQDTIKDLRNMLIDAIPGFEFPRHNLYDYIIQTEIKNEDEVLTRKVFGLTYDELTELLEYKQTVFDAFADKSVAAERNEQREVEVDEKNVKIKVCDASRTGVSQIKSLNPYKIHRAETAFLTDTEYVTDENGEITVKCKTGDVLCIRGVDFNEVSQAFAAKVKGKGIQMLRDAGINVEVGVCEKECLELNRKFITFHEKKRPYITLKWARTPDGYIDALRADAEAVGIPFRVIDNGNSLAGTELTCLGAEAKTALETADVILSKGQANVESLYGSGYNIYYAFLIKCQRFIELFGKEKFTPMLVREREDMEV